MGHTSGPWEVDGVEIYPVNGHRACDAICEMKPGFLDANAALIAAAPELLAALQQAYSCHEDDFEQVWLSPAAAAIAKATGAA